jgi:hypothetical protein
VVTAAIIISVTAFLCVGVWCSTWRTIRFKQADDFLTAQREGYAAQRNVARDMAKQMVPTAPWTPPDEDAPSE